MEITPLAIPKFVKKTTLAIPKFKNYQAFRMAHGDGPTMVVPSPGFISELVELFSRTLFTARQHIIAHGARKLRGVESLFSATNEQIFIL